MKYIKQLDAVRAIAALMVIFNHWLPKHYSASKIPLAATGVNTFFVLSGFLITWILLENKNKVIAGTLTNPSVLKSFYIRRTLRIFPIYYLSIVILFFAYKYLQSNIDFSVPYFLTYTSNFYFFKIQSFEALGAHLWSLSVEEQFYLFWPAIILFTSRKYLIHVIIGFIAAGIASEILLRNEPFGFLITTSCFYVFGAGALLAWFVVYKPQNLGKLYKALQIPAIVAFAYYVLTVSGIFKGFNLPTYRPVDSILAFFLITFLVYKILKGQNPAFGFIWNNKSLISMGKISYGIYLYHPFVAIGVYKMFSVLHLNAATMLPMRLGEWVFIAISFVTLLIVARLSWILIEKPLLNLKRYFEYNRDQKQAKDYTVVTRQPE